MKHFIKVIKRSTLTAVTCAWVGLAGSAASAPLSLPDQPLFLSEGVVPNLVMAIDDSGSMDYEVLFPTNDGAAWWRTNNDAGTCSSTTRNSFVGCGADGTNNIPADGRLNFNNGGGVSGTWKKFIHLFPNGCNNASTSYQRRLCDSTADPVSDQHDHFAIPPLPTFGWARSPDYNKAYFNPSETYEPWPDGGGFTFADSSPTAARWDPVFGTAATAVNLTRDIAGNGQADVGADCTNTAMPGTGIADNYYFRVYTGMTLPANTCIRRPGVTNWERVRSEGCIVGTNNACYTRRANNDERFTLSTNTRVAIRYFPATFFIRNTTPLPATFGYTGLTIAATSPDGVAMNGYEIKPGNFQSTAHYDAAIQNFANWFTYYRKRHQALRGGLGESFLELSGMRVGGFTINNRSTVTVSDISDSTNKQALYNSFYEDWTGAGGTPNRNAVAHMISTFRRTDASAPVQYACQKNFGILFTDGFSNPPATGDGLDAVGNLDGTSGAPYQDSTSHTMADGVMGAYVNPLRTGTAFPTGRVTVPAACGGGNPDPRLDCNRNLHMNFFAVTLGTRGLLFNPDSPADPYITNPSWPTTFPQRHPSAVDDLWHATINGRGQLLNANSPREISEKLTSVLNTVVDRTASASSASVNSGTISSDTRIYQARFNSATWTGQLLSYSIDQATGTLGTLQWDASEHIPEASARQIITVDSSGTAVPFAWDSLDTTRQMQIHADPTTGAALVNYLRGDATNEGTDPGEFRVRADSNGANKLGDIVSSSPLFVGPPRFRYPDSLANPAYSGFAAARANRRGVVYVGANDGMLHAFDAEDGDEIFAFVPSPVFPRLQNLASQSYNHQFYVDGPPSMGDVYFGGNWHTVLVGGLNQGGQGIYALDITDPSQLETAQANPGSVVLWEFTDADDADLGLTYSQPAIVRLRNGRWAAVFGNGYNNTAADGNASVTGNAVLYIVDMETGALIRKLDTGSGIAQAPAGITMDNGLATPALVDINGDRTVEYAFAGDLYGNLWKFDLSSTSSADWSVAFTDGSGQPAPLYQARDASGNAQPITVRPEVARGPNGGGMMVLFGTGKYMEAADKLLTPQRRQTFYGIVDRNTGADTDRVANRTVLTAQTIIAEPSFDPDGAGPLGAIDLRVTSNNPLGSNRGWYMDLVSPTGYEAEKQVTNPVVRNGNVLFTTLIPDADPCSSGGTSWIMELDLLSGSRLESPTFDLNNDGVITDADTIEIPGPGGTTIRLSPSGTSSSEGILQAAAILEALADPSGGSGGGSPKCIAFLPGSSGGIQRVVRECGPGATGRQSWRQIR